MITVSDPDRRAAPPARRHSPLAWMLHGRGGGWLAAGALCTLVQALSEYALTALLILFLFALELVDPTRIPSWVPGGVATLGVAVLLLAMVGTGVARALCQIASGLSAHAVLELVRKRLRQLHSAKMLLLSREPPSLSDVNMHHDEYLHRAADFVYTCYRFALNLLLLGTLLAGMLYLAWREALVGLLCLGLAAPFVRRLNRASARIAAELPAEQGLIKRALVRVCKNWLLLRIMRLERREQAALATSFERYSRRATRFFLLANLAAALPQLLGVVAVAAIVLASRGLFDTPGLDLVGFVYLFATFAQQASGLTENLSSIVRYRRHFGVACELVASVSPAERAAAMVPPASPPAATDRPAAEPPAIVVEGVTFAWPGAPAPVIEDLSLRVAAGSSLAVVGANGAGKSTLLGIILGVLRPSAGRVLIDGVAADDFLGQRDDVGYVGTDNYLFLGTVKQNLLYGLERPVTDEELWQALRETRMDGVIRRLDRGWDHVIGENEDGFSAGEKQRLALTRAFLRRPSLLILDEPSANLDVEAEAELAEILAALRGRCTTIIVSHKPGVLAGVEQHHRMTTPGATPAAA